MNRRERTRSRLGMKNPEVFQQRSGNKARPSVDLKIECLILTGVSPAERWRIADALSGELTRLLTDRGLRATPRAAAAHERMDAGSIMLESGASGETTGRQIARALYRNLGDLDSALPDRAGKPVDNPAVKK